MKRITTSKIYKLLGPYSYGTFFNSFFFSSGITGINKTKIDGNINDEVEQMMQNLKELLTENDLTFNQVVKVTLYLKDMQLYDLVNRKYKEYFTQKNYPARTCIAVKELPGKANVEIELIAARRQK